MQSPFTICSFIVGNLLFEWVSDRVVSLQISSSLDVCLNELSKSFPDLFNEESSSLTCEKNVPVLSSSKVQQFGWAGKFKQEATLFNDF